MILTRNRVAPWRWSKKIETCWRNFKCFNVKKFYVCALVGVLIKWLYEMHGATMKIFRTAVILGNDISWLLVIVENCLILCNDGIYSAPVTFMNFIFKSVNSWNLSTSILYSASAKLKLRDILAKRYSFSLLLEM